MPTPTWILAAAIASASLAPAPPVPPPADPNVALAIGLGAGLVAIAPPFLGANAVVSLGTAAVVSTLPYAYMRDPWRAAGAPLAIIGSGLLGALVGNRIALPLMTGRSPSLGSDAGTDWTEGGFLAGLALFEVFSAWDAWRLAGESAPAASPQLEVK